MQDTELEDLAEGINAKRCSTCKELKPYTAFTNRARNKDGKESQCKACIAKQPSNSKEARKVFRKRHYDKNPDKHRKRANDFYYANMEQCQAASNKWKYANWDYVLAYTRKYYNENHEDCLIKAKVYRDENKETLSERNKVHYYKDIEKSRLRVRNWQLNNPEKYAANCVRRRYRCMQSTPEWLTKEDKKDIASFYILARELGKVADVPFHVDHIVPLKHDLVCGLHVPWNLQVLTATENLSKSNKFTVE